MTKVHQTGRRRRGPRDARSLDTGPTPAHPCPLGGRVAILTRGQEYSSRRRLTASQAWARGGCGVWSGGPPVLARACERCVSDHAHRHHRDARIPRGGAGAGSCTPGGTASPSLFLSSARAEPGEVHAVGGGRVWCRRRDPRRLRGEEPSRACLRPESAGSKLLAVCAGHASVGIHLVRWRLPVTQVPPHCAPAPVEATWHTVGCTSLLYCLPAGK